jgi:hypothetical protein
MTSLNTAGIENITPEFLSMIKLPDEQGEKRYGRQPKTIFIGS